MAAPIPNLNLNTNSSAQSGPVDSRQTFSNIGQINIPAPPPAPGNLPNDPLFMYSSGTTQAAVGGINPQVALLAVAALVVLVLAKRR